ncbi:MAG: hypothetical protein RLY24_839 [Actinomycetota bacterium]|jgi:hypothetical protein
MEQVARGQAVREFIEQLNAGCRIPELRHDGARIFFEEAVRKAAPKTCVVCGLQLVGRQFQLCAGHWDWLKFEPLEEFEYEMNPRSSLIEFLHINLQHTIVVPTMNNWQAALHGHSTCELCYRITLNVEQLVMLPFGTTLKRHTVCPEHATFRWEDPIGPE